MNKRIVKYVAIVLVTALVLNVLFYPTEKASASHWIDDNQITISYEVEVFIYNKDNIETYHTVYLEIPCIRS
ncbi:MAG: hypothetical protein AAGU75_05715 [Bacillota bacterium]